MSDKKKPCLLSSLITHHSSLPLQSQAQAVNLLHVEGLALGVRGAARAHAARDARAVEGQLAGRPVELLARAPARKAALAERAPGRRRAPAHGAQAHVLLAGAQP